MSYKKSLACLLVVLGIATLSACSLIRQKSTESTETIKEVVQKESQNSKTSVDYNGSYYFVKGKYDEIPIINKKHPLDASYNPGEDSEALKQFEELKSDMQELGYDVGDSYSGFRSYEYQGQLYQSYVERDGQEMADTYSARPGYSEHQSGLAFDLMDTSGNLLENSEATTWLAKHAHEYGFIVRYIKGKEDITGYQAETWHIRYVGKEAMDIYESDLTLEEYFGVEGGDYEE